VFSIRDERNSEKQSELKGERFSEEETAERANGGANEGRAWGEPGATIQAKGRNVGTAYGAAWFNRRLARFEL
jgi:hypothetical protein